MLKMHEIPAQLQLDAPSLTIAPPPFDVSTTLSSSAAFPLLVPLSSAKSDTVFGFFPTIVRPDPRRKNSDDDDFDRPSLDRTDPSSVLGNRD